MKKLITAAAAVSLAAAMLTGCEKKQDYGWDIPTKYKAYLDYAFDGDYEIREDSKNILDPDTDDACGYTDWVITFTAYNGEKYERYLSTFEYNDRYKEIFASEKALNDNLVSGFVIDCIGEKAAAEFFETIFKDTFGGEYNYDNLEWRNGDLHAHVTTSCDVCGTDLDGEIVKTFVLPNVGHTYAESDLISYMTDADMNFVLRVTAEDGVDVEDTCRKLEKVLDDFMEYTIAPMNFSFILDSRPADKDGNINEKTVYRRSFEFGEENEDSITPYTD